MCSFVGMPRRERYTRDTIGEFEQICSLTIENIIPFYIYKSVSTGITICFAETESSFVSSYFNLGNILTRIALNFSKTYEAVVVSFEQNQKMHSIKFLNNIFNNF